MRKNNCDLIRRELDELMLDEACSASATEHLKECSDCREFHQTQTKLRRMVGSLGTVAAPADFDFRLRARLANGSSNAFHFWPVVQRGFAVAAVLVVFGFGVVIVRNVVNQRKDNVAEKQTPPVHQQSPQQVETVRPKAPPRSEDLMVRVPATAHDRIRSERPVPTGARTKRPLTSFAISMQRAEVISESTFGSEAATVFPIDASLQPFKLSLDDGRGNARTISVPTIRFGSQRMLPIANQYAQKGIW